MRRSNDGKEARIARSPAKWQQLPLWGWFTVLGVTVLWSTLRPGYLLLLDAIDGPQAEWQPLLPLPSQGLVAPSMPAVNLLRSVGWLHPQLPIKLVIALTLIGAGVGMFRLLTRTFKCGPWSAVAAATFYAVNPYMHDRLLAGQILVTAAFALLPWGVASFVRLATRAERVDIYTSLLWIAALMFVDVHIGGMAVLLGAAALLASPRGVGSKALVVGGLLLTVAGLIAFWALPSLLTGEQTRLGSGDLIAYAPRPRSAKILPRVLMLHGFWRTEFQTPIDLYPTRFLFAFIPLVATAVVGVSIAVIAWFRRFAWALLVAVLVAVVLGMGRSFPLTRPLIDFMYDSVPGYGIYREPQKWVALIGLGYSIFVGIALGRAERRLRQRDRRLAPIVAGAAILPLIATSAMLWAFNGRLDVSQFPAGWQRAEEVTSTKDEGAILLFPWHLYQPLPFTQNRTIANPGPSFFSAPVLISDHAGLFVRNQTKPPDPRDDYILDLLRRRRRIENFGHLVAPLNARYVALAKVSDWKLFGFLERQEDLSLVFDTPDMRLFENQAWTGSTYELEEGGPTDYDSLLGDSESERNAISRLQVLEPGPGIDPPGGPGLVRALPGWRTLQAPESGLVTTDLSCGDGWRLGEAEAQCHLGAVAAFEIQDDDHELWRPGILSQILGGLITIVTLIVLVLRRKKLE